MFKLVIEDDEGNKTVVPVIRDEISIGRQEGNTIRLTERNVSRRHAKLVREDETLFFEEVDARYGTKKNGERIQNRALFDVGDVFLIGDYRLTLEGEGVEAQKPNGVSAPAPAPAPIPEPKKNPFTDAPTQITHRDDIERRSSQGTEILPAMPAKLVVISSNFAGQEFPLNRKEMVIGRADECDIIVDHRSVSTTHAKIVREPSGNYKIVDLNSKNGVKVSGEQYRAVHLKRGDVIELGHVKFRFVEPGENYIFTPPVGGSDEFEVTKSSSNTGMIVAGVVVIALVVGAVAYVMMGTPTDVGTETNPVATNSGTANSKTQDDPKAKAEAPDSWVSDQIAKAKGELSSGKPERAIVLLEATRDFPSASGEQRSEIDGLLTTARRERPLEKELELGSAAFDNGDYVTALNHFKKIPPNDDSPIYKILKEQDLAAKGMKSIISQARAAFEDGEVDEATKLVEEVLFYDDGNEDAAALREEIEASKEKVVVTKPKPKERDERPKPKTKDPAVAIEDARKALFAGNVDGAIKACSGVRNAACYRILGVAYKKKGDNAKSCTFFKKAGQNPSHCE